MPKSLRRPHHARFSVYLLSFILCLLVRTPAIALQQSSVENGSLKNRTGILRNVTVCIDPGHSRATRGAENAGHSEYQIAWQVAQRLRMRLEEAGAHVVLTKQNADENVTNERRAAIANNAHADLLLRLHCDAARDSGIATFFPDRQGEKNGVRGPSRQVIETSGRYARAFQAAVVRSLRDVLRDRGVRPDTKTQIGSQQGALTGSIYSKVPVVLVEMCVLTNPHDLRFIISSRGQERMARALTEGVEAAIRTKLQNLP